MQVAFLIGFVFRARIFHLQGVWWFLHVLEIQRFVLTCFNGPSLTRYLQHFHAFSTYVQLVARLTCASSRCLLVSDYFNLILIDSCYSMFLVVVLFPCCCCCSCCCCFRCRCIPWLLWYVPLFLCWILVKLLDRGWMLDAFSWSCYFNFKFFHFSRG